jgi:hypothetical protein
MDNWPITRQISLSYPTDKLRIEKTPNPLNKKGRREFRLFCDTRSTVIYIIDINCHNIKLMKYFIIKRKRAFLRMPFFVNDTRSSAILIMHENSGFTTNIIDRTYGLRNITNPYPISSIEFIPSAYRQNEKQNQGPGTFLATESRRIETRCFPRGKVAWLRKSGIVWDETVGLDWNHSARNSWHRDDGLAGVPHCFFWPRRTSCYNPGV